MKIECPRHKLFSGTMVVIVASTLTTTILGPAMAEGGPTWRPQASERLVKLPSTYLQRTLDYDFEQSDLAQAMRDIGIAINFKTLTLSDLQAAIGQADGNVLTELRHQFLAEKSEYIELAGTRHALQRQQLETRMEVLDGIINELALEQEMITPARQQLIDQQQAARSRFKVALPDVELSLVETAMTPETTYAREFAANFAAIEALTLAIQSHSMNESAMDQDSNLTKREYLLQMIADVEAELSLLDQQEKIIGHMAKLVALDAMSLSEELMGVELAQTDAPAVGNVRVAIDFFVPN